MMKNWKLCNRWDMKHIKPTREVLIPFMVNGGRGGGSRIKMSGGMERLQDMCTLCT